MSDGAVLQRTTGAGRGDRPGWDLVISKLRSPVLRPGTVRRSSLIERLAREDPSPIVSVVAPAGYGKTTLLSQWAEINGRAFAWVSIDEADNDAKVLLRYVAAALDEVQPLDGRVFDALASPVSSVPGSVVPRLGSAFAAMTTPVVLVLDDVHLLHDRECRAALSVLADHVPAGSRLAFAGRDEPPLRVARLRAEGKILEIVPGDLSLSAVEAAALLRAAEVMLGEADVVELHRRTEGWAAGLYLAALYLREGGSLSRAAASFGGDDRLVSEYLESEFLERISRRRRMFLTRSAVLGRMCGSLCEVVLEVAGSAVTLADLAKSNLLLVPLDRRGEWYRYHHLFRDMLLAELERLEPDRIPVLQGRAAGWYLRRGMPEVALDYYMAAGDVDAVARLVQELWLATDRQGRIHTLQRWYQWLDERGAIEGRPMLAVLLAFHAAVVGRPADAERWAAVVDRWQYQDAARADDPLAEAWAAALRATLCRRGVEQMRADADEAARGLAAQSIVAPLAPLLQGLACVLGGELESGEAFYEDATSMAEKVGAHETLAVTLCERSIVAMARDAWSRAEALADQAHTVLSRAGIEDNYVTPLLCAVQARAALRRGNTAAARQELARAQRLRPALTYVLPHLAVQARIELARVHLALADLAGARTLMHEVDEVLRRRPGLGILVDEASALRTRLARQRGVSVPGASALTAAELRLLPLLCTHMSYRDIAAELFLSPHTVRSEIKSVYRKLNASRRSEAVTRARELGLLEGGQPIYRSMRDEIRSAAPSNSARWRAETYGPDGEIPGHPAQAGDLR
jgi:LuxR family transcriptional regulator, maltose regulon positive regulatory protein